MKSYFLNKIFNARKTKFVKTNQQTDEQKRKQHNNKFIAYKTRRKFIKMKCAYG